MPVNEFMKRTKGLFGILLMVVPMLVACDQFSEFDSPAGRGQGELTITLNANTGFGTRAVTESVYGNVDNYTIVVTDKDGVEKMRCKGMEIPFSMPLVLSMGSYKVEACYGVEHDASRDEFYVFGKVEGNIEPGKTEAVEVTCTPTCGRIAVSFDELMSTFFSDYNVTFTGTEALGAKTIEWRKEDTEPWYVKLKEGGEIVSFTITTTANEEFVNSNQQSVATKKGSFTLDRNRGYKMNISPKYNPSGTGEVGVTITIDDSTNDIPVDIEVPVDWI